MYLTLGAHAQRVRAEGKSTWFVILSVCPSVCSHVFFRYAQQDGQKVIPTGSVPHWLYLKNSDFGKNAGVKQSEGANMQISTGLPRPALRTLEAPEVATQDEYRLLRATV